MFKCFWTIFSLGAPDASRQGHTNYTADGRQAANLLGHCPVCFLKQIFIYSIAYKTAFMTSAKQCCCTVLSSGTEATYTGKPYETLGKTKDWNKCSISSNWLYRSFLMLLNTRGTYSLKKFSFNMFGKPTIALEVTPSSTRNSACFLLPLGAG